MKALVIGMCGNSLFYIKETNELLYEEPGGKGYNQAVGLKKFNCDVSFLGAIGKDESGNKCFSFLDNIGINNLLIKKDEVTTYARILVDKDGNNEIDVHFGAKLDLNDLDYIKQMIDEHDLIMLQNEIDINLNIEILKYAKSSNKLILVNPAPIATWLKDYLSLIDVITPNEEEARSLFDIPKSICSLEIGKYLQDKVNSTVIVTLGNNGSLLIKDGSTKHFPALKVVAVDTTGAGDLMNASIAYGILNNISIEDSIIFGTKACAYSVQRRYVLKAYPTLSDLL